MAYKDDIRAILDSELPSIRDEILDEITKSIINLKEDTKTTAPPFYSFNDLIDMRIMGYPVRDLVIVAERLRAGKVDIVKLKNYNAAFIDGYQKAQEDFKKSLQDSVNRIIESNKDV